MLAAVVAGDIGRKPLPPLVEVGHRAQFFELILVVAGRPLYHRGVHFSDIFCVIRHRDPVERPINLVNLSIHGDRLSFSEAIGV